MCGVCGVGEGGWRRRRGEKGWLVCVLSVGFELELECLEEGYEEERGGKEHSKQLTIIRTIRTRNQLLPLPLKREPRFQIPLLGRCEVQGARDDTDDAVGKGEGLVEVFRGEEHCF